MVCPAGTLVNAAAGVAFAGAAARGGMLAAMVGVTALVEAAGWDTAGGGGEASGETIATGAAGGVVGAVGGIALLSAGALLATITAACARASASAFSSEIRW